jgi:hypothetical protein
MTWHLEAEAIARYDAGLSEGVSAASIEAHLERCADCRQLVPCEEDWLEQRWGALAEEVYQPTVIGIEQLLGRIGVPGHLTRLVAVTASLQPAWLIALTFALTFAGLASQISGSDFDLFLAVAPLVPVVGVALAYGRRGDPAHEILISSPLDTVRVLFLRVATVTITAFAIAGMIDVLTGGRSGFGLWLLPSVALVVLTLALGTRISLWSASMVSVAAWISYLAIESSRLQVPTAGVLGGRTQAWFVAVAVVAGMVLVRRVDHYRRGQL